MQEHEYAFDSLPYLVIVWLLLEAFDATCRRICTRWLIIRRDAFAWPPRVGIAVSGVTDWLGVIN